MTLTQPAWGIALATLTEDEQVLDAWFPAGRLGLTEPAMSNALLPNQDAEPLLGLIPGTLGPRPLRGLHAAGVFVAVDSLDNPPKDTLDAWLRLHLLSHRLIRPHDANLDGVFGLLNNVAWTSAGPCPPDRVDELRGLERGSGRHLAVYGVDKFPRMTDYVVPSGVRIADGDRVRLGAHLAPGTTVMHSGFVNFNAGTLGTCMVEGRITAGTVIGDGTDVGAGASIMGTLSGGGTNVIRVGERCLLGANSGIGISLGDDCVVEAGCYVTASAKITLPDGLVVKAQELSGQSGLLFWRNSVSGALEVRTRSGTGITLNAALHTN